VVCGVLVWALAPCGAALIYKRVPAGTRSLALLLGINLALYACRLPQSFGLTALRRAQGTLYASAWGVGVQACLCWMLIRRFHLPGAAISLGLGSLAALLVREVLYRREMRVATHTGARGDAGRPV
jgi:O-antigen/teichoic acid export membrane protein